MKAPVIYILRNINSLSSTVFKLINLKKNPLFV